MKFNFLINFLLISVFFLPKISTAQSNINSQPNVIPSLRHWEGGTGFFKLNKNTKLLITNTDTDKISVYVNTFREDLNRLLPYHSFKISNRKPKPGDIFFKLNTTDSVLKKEGYRLIIGDYITIEAAQPIGAFWATRSILQLLDQAEYKDVIAKGTAIDYPDYELRGFVLDVGRKFFSIKFLRDYVKLMSYYKLNDFQIHLNDNGFKEFFDNNWDKTYSAFRLENETYPNLTAKDGHYTKNEFIDLQKLAESYGVKIIPEIDVPAHSLAFVKAVPEIGSKIYGMDHLDINNPKTKEVIDNVFKEYLSGNNPVFRGDEVHIGTDEYAKKEAEKFREFTDYYIKYVESFGKKARLWGALSHAKGNTPVKIEGVSMNIWYNGYADPKDMINLGYKVISTPDGWLYIVPKAGYYYDYLNLEKIYREWAPNIIGNQTFDRFHPQIRGGSFAVWNDHVGNGITEKDVTDRVFPAIQVLAQKMWDSKSDKISYKEFAQLSDVIGEGPGLNLRGKVKSVDSLVLHYDFYTAKFNNQSKAIYPAKPHHILFENISNRKAAVFSKGKNSYIETPIEEIGYDYTVSFWLNPSKDNKENAILFSSADAQVKLKQGNTSKLGFSRENYHYNFDYSVPVDTWSHLVIAGNNKGTSLYVNGKLVEKLEGAEQLFSNTKSKIAKVQTLFFPLKYIGAVHNSFKGAISDFKVFNKILSIEEIKKLPESID